MEQQHSGLAIRPRLFISLSLIWADLVGKRWQMSRWRSVQGTPTELALSHHMPSEGVKETSSIENNGCLCSYPSRFCLWPEWFVTAECTIPLFAPRCCCMMQPVSHMETVLMDSLLCVNVCECVWRMPKLVRWLVVSCWRKWLFH